MMVYLLLSACTPPPATDTADTAEEPVGFQSAAACGKCHERQYSEWRQSMHAYAALSPVFDAMTAKAFRDTDGGIDTFCTGCHTPIGTAAGEPGTTYAADRSPLSREGVTCEVCHTSIGRSGPLGDARLEHQLGTEFGPYDDPLTTAHPASGSDFVPTPVLCGSCHDVYMFPGLRIEEAYTEHVTSPSYAEGVRCQDCHMSPEPGAVADRPTGPSVSLTDQAYPDREQATHLFVGPDYSLLDAFPYADDADASAAAREANLERVQALLQHGVRLGDVTVARADGTLNLSVTVASLAAGHNVPTGFTSERQLWLEITVTDATGAVVYRSGDLDGYGDLRDPLSWEVHAGDVPEDTDLVNFQSENVVYQREYTSSGTFDYSDTEHDEANGETLAVFPFDANYIRKRSLSPLEARTVGYAIPDPGPCVVDVALHYRNLPPYVLRALQRDDLVERLHLFTLGQAHVEVP